MIDHNIDEQKVFSWAPKVVLEVFLLEICPYLYIVSPLCTSLTLIRLYKFYTLRKWASLQKTRRVLSPLREENNFALPYMYTFMCIWVALAKFH